MKRFDFQKAKAGAPVETRDGHKARILCFDRKVDHKILALVDYESGELVMTYTETGLYFDHKFDLVMAEGQGPGDDPVNSPKHYTSHPSGVECIQIAEHYNFCIGNAIKYLWRHGLKESNGLTPGEKSIQDLEKAVWYINREIENIKRQ